MLLKLELSHHMSLLLIFLPSSINLVIFFFYLFVPNCTAVGLIWLDLYCALQSGNHIHHNITLILSYPSLLDGKGAPHEVLEIINVKIQLKTYPVSIRNFYVLHAFLLMVDNNISTHVMVKPCFQGIEQDIMLKHSKDKIPGFFLTLFLPIFSRCFSSLPRFEIFFSEKTIFLTSVFSPSVPDCGRREWWR